MKQGSLFLIAFLAAAFTFGSLMAFVGSQNSGWNRDRYGWHGGWHHHHYDNDYRYDKRPLRDTN